MIDYQIVENISYQSFADLYFKANNRVFPTEIFNWLYLNNPFGNALGITANSEGKMVGFMAFFPWEMKYSGQSFKSIQIGNLVVDPLWQRKGIFGEIRKEMERFLDNSEYKFAFGFPNKLSSIGFHNYRKTIWKEPMESYKIINFKTIFTTKSTENIPIGNLFNLSRDKHEYRFDIVDKLKFDDEISFKDRLISNRTSDFFNWRFLECPTINANCVQISKDNKAIGYVILSLKENKIEIFDFYIYDSEIDMFHLFLKKAMSHLKKRFCSILYCGDSIFLPHFKLKSNFQQDVLIIPSDNIDIDVNKLKCHFTYLDTDFYMI